MHAIQRQLVLDSQGSFKTVLKLKTVFVFQMRKDKTTCKMSNPQRKMPISLTLIVNLLLDNKVAFSLATMKYISAL